MLDQYWVRVGPGQTCRYFCVKFCAWQMETRNIVVRVSVKVIHTFTAKVISGVCVGSGNGLYQAIVGDSLRLGFNHSDIN